MKSRRVDLETLAVCGRGCGSLVWSAMVEVMMFGLPPKCVILPAQVSVLHVKDKYISKLLNTNKEIS